MSQHDYNVANQSSSAFRTDMNNALMAAASTNSGSSNPATAIANMIYYNTSTNQLRKLDEAGSTWIILGTVDEANARFEPNQKYASQAEAEAGADNGYAMSPVRVKQAIYAFLNTTGTSAPLYAIRAWVNFNGTGVVAIKASGNVASITDNGVGDYTINFTTNMADANYAVSVSSNDPTNIANVNTTAKSSSAVRIKTNADLSDISVMVVR